MCHLWSIPQVLVLDLHLDLHHGKQGHSRMNFNNHPRQVPKFLWPLTGPHEMFVSQARAPKILREKTQTLNFWNCLSLTFLFLLLLALSMVYLRHYGYYIEHVVAQTFVKTCPYPSTGQLWSEPLTPIIVSMWKITVCVWMSSPCLHNRHTV